MIRIQPKQVIYGSFFCRSRRYPDLNKLEAELESVREEKLRAKKKRKLAAADKAADSMSSDGYDTDSTVASGMVTNAIFIPCPFSKASFI